MEAAERVVRLVVSVLFCRDPTVEHGPLAKAPEVFLSLKCCSLLVSLAASIVTSRPASSVVPVLETRLEPVSLMSCPACTLRVSPLKVLEYLAAGLPVVASRTGPVEALVEDGRDGLLVEPGDVEALAAALREAEALPPERLAAMGRQARADVESGASLDRVVGRLTALYRGAHPRDLRQAS